MNQNMLEPGWAYIGPYHRFEPCAAWRTRERPVLGRCHRREGGRVGEDTLDHGGKGGLAPSVTTWLEVGVGFWVGLGARGYGYG
jgi:hypothetical protein